MYVNSKKIIKKFYVELSDENGNVKKINVLPPKIKILEMIEDLKNCDEQIGDTKAILLEILNKNEEKTEISEEFFDDAVDVISFHILFEDIVNWINGVEKN